MLEGYGKVINSTLIQTSEKKGGFLEFFGGKRDFIKKSLCLYQNLFYFKRIGRKAG